MIHLFLLIHRWIEPLYVACPAGKNGIFSKSLLKSVNIYVASIAMILFPPPQTMSSFFIYLRLLIFFSAFVLSALNPGLFSDGSAINTFGDLEEPDQDFSASYDWLLGGPSSPNLPLTTGMIPRSSLSAIKRLLFSKNNSSPTTTCHPSKLLDRSVETMASGISIDLRPPGIHQTPALLAPNR